MTMLFSATRPAALLHSLLTLVLLIAVAGCTQTQPRTAPVPDAEPVASSNTLSQTGARAAEDGATMPMDRTVALLDMEEPPITSEAASSQAVIDRIVAAPTGTRVDDLDTRVDSLLALMTWRSRPSPRRRPPARR